MAELVDALASGVSAARCVGSSPYLYVVSMKVQKHPMFSQLRQA